ncbi:proline-rich transmembrane protein 3 [Denticeps clupeoides]|uniref:Proline-rich transmembrane protein 3/4 domain-containing protein n=1 Tax=Denticeps clupeoides TaxID=299321 RepID=A0AAY4DBM1_9TELE|nr:proline-rich transmembrane protein 3-like [Denticeps clupeoides]XP_028840905.1 proline-rich transmembrane protein 3-like [Denticeps clupeoides]
MAPIPRLLLMLFLTGPVRGQVYVISQEKSSPTTILDPEGHTTQPNPTSWTDAPDRLFESWTVQKRTSPRGGSLGGTTMLKESHAVYPGQGVRRGQDPTESPVLLTSSVSPRLTHTHHPSTGTPSPETGILRKELKVSAEAPPAGRPSNESSTAGRPVPTAGIVEVPKGGDESTEELLRTISAQVAQGLDSAAATEGDLLAQFRPEAETRLADANPAEPTVVITATSTANNRTSLGYTDTQPTTGGVKPRTTARPLGRTGFRIEGQAAVNSTSRLAQTTAPSPPRRTSPLTTTTNEPKNGFRPSSRQNSTTTASKAPVEAELRETQPPITSTALNLTRTESSPSTPPSSGRRRFLPPVKDGGPSEQNRSISMARFPPPILQPGPSPSPSGDPCAVAGSKDCVDMVSEVFGPNGTSLVWTDLQRTLSFAWELHVFGSATLFLLLAAGAAVGVVLSPAARCPCRGALALANALLLLAGLLRAIHFLLDPYGARLLLPRPAVTALCTLPLPLLLWALAALIVLVIRGSGVELEPLPPSLLRLPLLAVSAVLQCTLLLAADLLSPALSPAVPFVLQGLSVVAGLVLCLGFLCLALPRVRQAGKAPGAGPALAVCALLGALCCALHVQTCLWLYGMLGDWRTFGWTWWLCQFWARLLELAWAFCLLLLASWVFWRPRGSQRGSGGAAGAGGVAGELPSPAGSTGTSLQHTCWSKIVQSLKGRPCRKAETAGTGGSGGSAGGSSVAGDMPNNWAGQERPGADISKSLIRNREPPKESNRGRNQAGSAGSLLRLQAAGRTPARSLSDKDSTLSLGDFDLRPPSPIDLSRSIDEALHREHLLRGGSLFRPLRPPSPPLGPWLRRNSDPQLTLSDSSDDHTALTDSSTGLGGAVNSSVPSRQVTAPPTPTHQGPRFAAGQRVPFSLSCPVSLRPSCNSVEMLTPGGDDTRPFLTPDVEGAASEGRRYLRVRRQDDSASVSSDIIDL